MSFVNRQLYKQKPSAWGPVSAVQASIFKNAERIGIDPSSLKLNFPFWSPGNQVELISAKSFSPINTTFGIKGSLGNGLYFNTPLSSYVNIGSIGVIRSSGAPLTVLCFGHVLQGAVAGVIIGSRNGSGAGDLFKLQRSTSTNLQFQYDPTGSGATVTTTSNLLYNSSFYCAAGRYNGSTIDLITKSSVTNIAKISSTSKPSAALDQDNYSIGARTDSLSEYVESHIYSVELYTCALTDEQIAFRFDNPYFLLHRVAPVFYSVPGGAITIKRITDTVSCLDEIAQISNIFALSDMGTCLDGFSGLIAGLSVVDAGAGVDTVKPIAYLTVQDTGSAIDLIQQILSGCSVTDTCAGADNIWQLLSAIFVSDICGGADVISILKALLKTVTDSVTGTDSLSQILASISVIDTGSSADTISKILADIFISDSGAGIDFINLLKDILKTISDTGSGTENVSIQPVSVSVQDASAALDIIGYIAVALSVSDASTIAEIISTIKTKLVNVTDAVAGYDSEPTISVSVTVSDAAVALDVIGQVINALAVYDIGSGLDRITKTDFDILPSGKVMVTFTIKTPGASFAMRTPKATFNIE